MLLHMYLLVVIDLYYVASDESANIVKFIDVASDGSVSHN
jgi:hypothetical protein